MMSGNEVIAGRSIGAELRADGPAELDIVAAYLLSRRSQNRLLALTSAMAVAVLALTVAHGWSVMRPLPDLVTFAFRV